MSRGEGTRRTNSHVVVGVREGAEGGAVARGRPSPGAGPARALDKDQLLSRTCRTDTVDTGLHL